MPNSAPTQFHRFEALSLAAALTVLAMVLPYSDPVRNLYSSLGLPPDAWLSQHRFGDLALIAMGLILVLPAPRASGLCIGRIREYWWHVSLLIGLPLVGTAIVYPLLPDRPFKGADLNMWLTSPLAQDLFFGGVIYRILRPHFANRVSRWLPFEWVLPVGGLFFAAWHLQNLEYFPTRYVAFQLLYTWGAYNLLGLTRQWTGSLLYVILAHMAGNFIVWYVDLVGWDPRTIL